MESAQPLAYVLDDDDGFCKLLSGALKRFGIFSESFSASAPLFSRSVASPPALCVLDLSVESLKSSLGLIKALRSVHSPNLPILIASGRMDPATMAEALESGANDYLTKPLEREVLISKLLRHVTSLELMSAAMTFESAPELILRVHSEIDATLLGFDELGIQISSRSLVRKGASITVAGSALSEVTGRTSPLVVRAASSELNIVRGHYETYLEFDSSDHDLLEKVRAWLAARDSPRSHLSKAA